MYNDKETNEGNVNLFLIKKRNKKFHGMKYFWLLQHYGASSTSVTRHRETCLA
jgi:hypothetical protein